MNFDRLVDKHIAVATPHKGDSQRRFVYYGTVMEVDEDYIVLRTDKENKEVYISHNEVLSIRVT